MPTVLHIQASPRGRESFSIRLGEAFIGAFLQGHPGWTAEVLNLFSADVPPFTAPAAQAKYGVMAGQQPADEAGRAWKPVVQAVNHFKSFDLYALSCPMWNFSIPYRLKQYLDVIVQPGLTFSYREAQGYVGLVTGKPAVLLLARGGEYSDAASAPYDMQGSYLRAILGFIGFTDIRSLIVEPTLQGGPATAEEKLRQAVAEARKLSRQL
jgi:FMN-dependent NADH-azoreductase